MYYLQYHQQDFQPHHLAWIRQSTLVLLALVTLDIGALTILSIASRLIVPSAVVPMLKVVLIVYHREVMGPANLIRQQSLWLLWLLL